MISPVETYVLSVSRDRPNRTFVVWSTDGRKLLVIDLETGEVTADLNSIDEAAEQFVKAVQILVKRAVYE